MVVNTQFYSKEIYFIFLFFILFYLFLFYFIFFFSFATDNKLNLER